MMDLNQNCPDCDVPLNRPHQIGCDVARCMTCGHQALCCDHYKVWGQVWTGVWPGDVEVKEGLATDLNDLALKGYSGKLQWDGKRWVALDESDSLVDFNLEQHIDNYLARQKHHIWGRIFYIPDDNKILREFIIDLLIDLEMVATNPTDEDSGYIGCQ